MAAGNDLALPGGDEPLFDDRETLVPVPTNTPGARIDAISLAGPRELRELLQKMQETGPHRCVCERGAAALCMRTHACRRGPYLAELELYRRCLALRPNFEEDTIHAALAQQITLYLHRFSHKPCAFADVATFMAILPAVMQRSVVERFAGHLDVDAGSVEDKYRRIVTLEKLRRSLPRGPFVRVPAADAAHSAGGERTPSISDISDRCVRLFRLFNEAHAALPPNLAPTERGACVRTHICVTVTSV
jgi:hypothetical protein